MPTNTIIPDTVLKKLNDLPREIRIKFWEQMERLLRDPSYQALRNEKLKGTTQRAFSITTNYRATYLRSEPNLIITGIGTHKDVLGK